MPANGERTTAPRFAVGDLVFHDVTARRARCGRATRGEDQRAAARLRWRRPRLHGHLHHWPLQLRQPRGRHVLGPFAGIPEGSRLAPTGTGNDLATDSNPDYTGATPPFTLGVNERNVRDVISADHVDAAYINPTIDAGITPLQFALMDQVWHDVNGDGVQQVTEPGVGATVSLLSADGAVLATTRATDAEGKYAFTDLAPGRYRVRFEGLPSNRAFTQRSAGSDRTMDSDVDPATGLTPIFSLSQGAPNLVPATDVESPASTT